MKTKLSLALIASGLFFLSGCATFVSDLKDPDPGTPYPQHVPYSYDGR
jgi:protein involved in sex pheromone biosynthesis